MVYFEWQRSAVVSIDGDLDPYVRLVRAGQLVRSGAWLDTSIPGAHLGEAEELAWSRPLDVLIIGLFLPLRSLMPERQALLLAGSLVSPLLWAFCVPLCMAVLRAMSVGPFGLLCGVLAFVCHPMLNFDFEFGRSDHHSLVQLCLLAFLALTLRALGPHERRNAALAAGVAAGFGIWVHPEAILLPAIVCGFLALRWCAHDALAARMLRDLSLGTLFMLVLATLSEHGPAHFFDVEHDRVSVVHLSIFAATAALSIAFQRLEPLLQSSASRLFSAGGLGGVALGILALVYPGFHQGPLAAMDPVLYEVWFSGLVQSQPLWRLDIDEGLEHLSVTLFMSAVAVASLLWHRRHAAPGARRRIEFLLLATLVMTTLAFGYRRLTGVLAFIYIPAAAMLAEALWHAVQRRMSNARIGARISRVVAVEGLLVAAALGPQVVLFGASALAEQIRPAVPASSQASCRRELLHWIQNDRIAALSGRDRALVLTRSGDAPALLFWTDHRIVAWNHHRSTSGLMLLQRFFQADDENALYSAARETGAELALYCPGPNHSEPYWQRDDPKPLPPWITLLAGERRGDAPVLLELAPGKPHPLAARGAPRF
jgi:hypothetical protein